MKPKMKLLRLMTLLSVALLIALAAPASVGTTQASNGTTIIRIPVGGRNAWVNLVDNAGGTGFLNASEDPIAHTKHLDFGYSTAHPTDPNLLIVRQGAGEIPDTAFTMDSTSAHLALTTPASYTRFDCVINTITGYFSCEPGPPIAFDLTWVRSGIVTVSEKKKSTGTLGPITTKSDTEYHIVTAIVSGTWPGASGQHIAVNLNGNLEDIEGKTSIREITVAANP